MPGDRDDEICQKALELLSDLCSKGEVQNEHCLDFIYYFRDLARPRYSDSGEATFARSIDLMGGRPRDSESAFTTISCWECSHSHDDSLSFSLKDGFEV